MIKRILLIGEEKSFMVSSIANGLRRELFEVVTAEPVAPVLKKLTEVPQVVLFYLTDNESDNSILLEQINNMIIDNRCRFYVLGNPLDMEDAYRYLLKQNVLKEFYRPINVQNIIEELLKIDETEAVRLPGRKKILLVDDDEVTLRTISNWLQERYTVYMANSGKDALRFLMENVVDLVLLDYDMPGLSGPDVLDAIRNDPMTESVPVMFLTGKNDQESVLYAVSLHPDKYLLKTLPKDDIIKTIDEFFLP
ncbi:MAG: response regulator [Lachnospiraceae bacterium]|nr:response regulator [Lachnospiraceae bacterium]